jgi:hypothetical protein
MLTVIYHLSLLYEYERSSFRLLPAYYCVAKNSQPKIHSTMTAQGNATWTAGFREHLPRAPSTSSRYPMRAPLASRVVIAVAHLRWILPSTLPFSAYCFHHGVSSTHSTPSPVHCGHPHTNEGTSGRITTIAGLCTHPCPFGTSKLRPLCCVQRMESGISPV